MKNFALAASFVGALGLVACGGGGGSGDDDVTLEPDSGPDNNPDGGGQEAECNPVTQQGCESGEKCTWIVENPDLGLGRTGCAANGDVSPGGACMRDADGIDNCMATDSVGYVCSGGVCTEACSQMSSSCSDGHCVLFNGLFDDVDNIGLCVPRCDTHLQDCSAEGEACYMFIPGDSVDGICAGIPMDATELEQGDTCLKGQSGNCFLNGCAGGFGPELLADGAMSIDLCAYYCEPQETYLDANGDPAGVTPHSPEGNAATTNENGLPAACGVNTSGGGHHCRFVSSSYNFGDNIDDTMIPDTIGFCAPVESSWGDCTTYQPSAIADFFEQNPEATQEEFDTFCNENGVCAFGCAKPETIDMIFGARGMATPDMVLVPPHLRGKENIVDEIRNAGGRIPGVQ